MAKKDTSKKGGKKDPDSEDKLELKERKEKEKQKQKTEKEEKKRINNILNFPVKFLTQLSLVIGLLFFMAKYFGSNSDLVDSFYYAFLLFAVIYLGGGLILILVVFMISKQKERERELKRKEQEERERLEDEKKQDELRRLEELQRSSSYVDYEDDEEIDNKSKGKIKNN